MSLSNNIWEVAEAYVNNELTEEQQLVLQSRIATDTSFATEFQDCVSMLQTLKSAAAHQKVRKDVKAVHNKLTAEPDNKQSIKSKSSIWRTASIAAGIAIITSFTTYWVMNHNNQKIASQYSLLRRDLEKYKRNQTKIINDIKEQATPVYSQAQYSGTGFALTSDGYMVTSYHVIAGADSIYVQNKNGDYFKAVEVASDKEHDVVILKAEAKELSFPSSYVPYTIADKKRLLGAKVFTLGFPQDEIVYNEGYISSKNGYGGDSSQYRLEIPAGPGQSGAPVMDESGNIIGIITGKEKESQGTTYAVSSKALLNLLDGLPKEQKVQLSSRNKLARLKREQQIELLEQYTCAIKVYKQ